MSSIHFVVSFVALDNEHTPTRRRAASRASNAQSSSASTNAVITAVSPRAPSLFLASSLTFAATRAHRSLELINHRTFLGQYTHHLHNLDFPTRDCKTEGPYR